MRFLVRGLWTLKKDAPRPDGASEYYRAAIEQIVRLTTQEKPTKATHWSMRSMAAMALISDSIILRIRHAHGLNSHRIDTFKLLIKVLNFG